MQPSTIFSLGGFEFTALEIPAQISVGGQQRIVVHERVGGTRVVDSMGRQDRPLEWSGIFMGSTAVDRSRFLDSLRIGGAVQALVWGEFNYDVKIQDFQADYRKAFEIPYRISCTVVSDLTTPATSAGQAPIDDALNDDLGAAEGLAVLLQAQATAATVGLITTIQSLVGAVSNAMAAVKSFKNAPLSTVASVLQPLSVAQTAVSSLISSNDSIIGSVTGFAGITPNTPSSALIDTLTTQLDTTTQQNTLFTLGSTLGRMSANLNSIVGSAKTITTAGGNLFQIAEQEYGDATAWTGIAKANKITDPFIQGTATLGIPIQPDSQDGVLDS